MTERPDDLDDFTAEELEMAARLGDQWDASRSAPSSSLDPAGPEIAPLLQQVALLRSVSDFELQKDQHSRGLSEVLLLAEKKSRSAPQKIRSKELSLFRRLLVWSPLPAVAVLAFVFAITDKKTSQLTATDGASNASSRPVAQASQDAEPKRAEPDQAAPWELAEVDPGAESEASEKAPMGARLAEKSAATDEIDSSQVLKAQAALLASRMGGQDGQTEESHLDLEMRDYRAKLLARLEARGR